MRPGPRPCRYRATATAVIALVGLGCAAGRGPTDAVGTASGDTVLLPIPNRNWAPEAPPEGWCGEASIQMAMGYYGQEVSQAAINAAGRPAHPDLWMDDIDPALDALGVTYTRWDQSQTDVNAFVEWIRANLRAGYPVLCGCKIYPDQDPDWFLDHFVLVVGSTPDGLYVNTNIAGDEQMLIPVADLTARTDGYSLWNAQRTYFGRAITGLR